ncbi:MAG: hypothetical protein M3O70_00740 [Actinomycetota bacterium]|nr:hypothetical protein [Actinomycetota bacterium]
MLTEAEAPETVGQPIAHMIHSSVSSRTPWNDTVPRQAMSSSMPSSNGWALVTADQRERWLARLDELGARDAMGTTPSTSEPTAVTDQPRSAGAVLEDLAGALATTTAGYARLYTTARLMFDATTYDLAAEHPRASTEAFQAITWVLSHVVGRELRGRKGSSAAVLVRPAASEPACA